MDRIREFLGAELDNVDGAVDGKVFSISYQSQGLEFYSYDPAMIQRMADFLHTEPNPEYIVKVTDGSKTSYYEATWRDTMDILQQPESEFTG